MDVYSESQNRFEREISYTYNGTLAEDPRGLLEHNFDKHRFIVNNSEQLNVRHGTVSCSSISVHYVAFGTKVTLECCEHMDFYTLHLPFRGSLKMRQGGEVAEADAQRAFIASPGQNKTFEFSADSIQRVVKISRKLVERVLIDLLGRNITTPVQFEFGMDTSEGVGSSWWDAVDYLEQEASKSISLFGQGGAARELERMLVTGLLYGQANNYSAQLASKECSIAPAHVRRAERYIEQYLAESISIEDMVKVAEVSKRSLYDGFKRFRGVSPMCYVRNLRLEKTRETLLNGDVNASVTMVATSWGFNHLGRFSVEYKKRFGESPSETLQKRNYLLD